jgi:hypothetical protein
MLLAVALVAIGSGVAGAERIRSGGIDFRGFIQASWLGNATSQQNEFRVDEVELEVGKEWADVARMLLRINFRHADSFDAKGNLGSLEVNKFVEQAWASIDLLKKRSGVTFAFGKFQLPIGYESINIPEMFQYSRSYTTEVGRPYFGTGAMVRFRRSLFDFALYAVNGWNTMTDNNDAKTFGGRLGFSLFDGDLLFGLSYVAGPEPIPNRAYTNVRSPRHVLDFDVLYTGVSKLTLGFEVNYGYEDRASQVSPDRRARWLSFLGTAHYRFLPWLAGTLRFEHADDPDGSRLYLATPQLLGTPAVDQVIGIPTTVESLTLAALFTIAENAHAVLEWRNDWLAREEDAPIYPAAAGGITKSRRLFAASIYYVW